MKTAKQTVINAIALAVVLGAGAIPSAHAQTFTLLHVFAGAPDGAYPLAGFVQDTAGNLYGTTQLGGSTAGVCATIMGFNNINGCGTIFKIDPTGAESVLYRFTGGTDGEFPASGLVIDGAGNLYGTTSAAVFKLDTAAKFSTLHSPGAYAGLAIDSAGILYGSSADGIFSLDPSSKQYTVLAPGVGSKAPLALDAARNLYGATEFAGGTVFELDTNHTYSTLHTFPQGPTDGVDPASGVIVDAVGNLYGTTLGGGVLYCLGGNREPIGCGTVFKLTPPGYVESVFSLEGGDYPNVGLVRDAAKNLYGSAEWSGPQSGTPGVLFKMTPSGAETVLFTFTGGGLDRSYPTGSLALDSSGNIYGTTYYGGSVGAGTAFKLNPTGAATYPLTIAPSGSGSGTVTGSIPGIVCPASCSAFYAPGTAVTLTANAASGSAFTTWGVTGCSGTGTCNVTTGSAETVVFATFDLDFSLSASALTPAAVSPGGSATSTLSVTAPSGFSGSVSFTCAVTPAPALAPTCLISPSSVAPGTPATLTVNTTGPTAAAMSSSGGSGLFFAFCLPLFGLVVTRVGLSSHFKSSHFKRTQGKFAAAALAGLICAGLTFQIACGGSSSTTGSKGTPTGTYTITVTGKDASGALVHSTPTTLKVQ